MARRGKSTLRIIGTTSGMASTKRRQTSRHVALPQAVSLKHSLIGAATRATSSSLRIAPSPTKIHQSEYKFNAELISRYWHHRAYLWINLDRASIHIMTKITKAYHMLLHLCLRIFLPQNLFLYTLQRYSDKLTMQQDIFMFFHKQKAAG